MYYHEYHFGYIPTPSEVKNPRHNHPFWSQLLHLYLSTKDTITTREDPPPTKRMIRSTFQSFIPYSTHCWVVFLMGCIIFDIISRWNLKEEFSPGSFVPDTAFSGYTPQQTQTWYRRLEEEERQTILFLTLLDILVIIPAYILGFGTQLLLINSDSLPYKNILCYLPIWIASFDIIETMTTLFAIASIHYGFGWVPSPIHLVLANVATQFKFFLMVIGLVIMGWQSIRSRIQKKKKTS